MKILHIITHYYPHVYGAENFAMHLAQHQAKQGHEVYVVTGRWQDSWPSEETLHKVKIYRVEVNKTRYIQTILSIWPLTRKARQIIQSKNIEVIHSHIYPGMLVGAKLKKEFALPWLATIQGGDIGDYKESFGPLGTTFKKIIGKALQKADLVHAVSSYLKKELVKMELDNKKITVVPNGVDVNKFTTQNPKPKNNNKIKLVTSSRLETKNNLTQLVKVVSDLTHKDYDITLDIYGTGSLEQALKTEIKTLRLEKIVKLKGYVKQSKLSIVLPNYDVFVRLSTQEGFGISFIEAMACGLLTIGTPVGGITDIITDRENAYLIDLNKNISKQFISIIKDRKNWPAISRNGRNTVTEKFAWSKVLTQMDQLYKKII
ncbi:glycosyltransferase family 4 protein [Candidatus Beckwithbacteria bacterium]|nr:glycosyltransferase family 4 protein [Candidatus Beckwithbacteria bacterium]